MEIRNRQRQVRVVVSFVGYTYTMSLFHWFFLYFFWNFIILSAKLLETKWLISIQIFWCLKSNVTAEELNSGMLFFIQLSSVLSGQDIETGKLGLYILQVFHSHGLKMLKIPKLIQVSTIMQIHLQEFERNGNPFSIINQMLNYA